MQVQQEGAKSGQIQALSQSAIVGNNKGNSRTISQNEREHSDGNVEQPKEGKLDSQRSFRIRKYSSRSSSRHSSRDLKQTIESPDQEKENRNLKSIDLDQESIGFTAAKPGKITKDISR